MYVQAGFPRNSSPVSEDKKFSRGGEVVGNPGPSLGLPWALAWNRAALVPVSQLSARTSSCALGGLHPGTNELIGEDLGVII